MARFELSTLFTDQAVLCRHREIRVFGKAEDGVCLDVTLMDAAGTVLASDRVTAAGGRFIACLPPQEAAINCTLRVSDGQTASLACDVAIGDVYLAGGQSNMELELKDADDGYATLRSHENVLVRYYNVPKYPMDDEAAEQANRGACWRSIRPGEARDMSAVAYFFAMKLQSALNVPIGVIDCYWGGTSISCWMEKATLESIPEGQRYLAEYEKLTAGKTLAQYQAEEAAWQHEMDVWNAQAEVLKRDHPGITAPQLNEQLGPYPWHPPAGAGSPFRPAGLAVSMLRRVVPMTLTGILYYQGEEDTWRTERYDELLRTLIRQLRAQFRDPALPFLNVQLPMWIEAGKADSYLWPRLRMAQQAVFDETRHSDLCVLIDQGEYDNIHPTNKHVVGDRLADCALRTVYGREAPEPPRATDKYTNGHTLTVRLTQPLEAPVQPDSLMEIAGEDGVYHPAEVQTDARQLHLASTEVDRPVKARYAWTDYALVPYFGKNGLPLAPFCLE